MRLVDTRNHLDFPGFDADYTALLQRSRALGVERQMVLSVYRENWQRVWDLAQAEDGLCTALGLRPVYLARYRPQHLDDLCQWLQRLRGETKLYMVDEIDLDHCLERLDHDAQQALFEAQLRPAVEFRLPALIHVRRARAAIIATLKHVRLERRGIVHTFVGSREEAREYLKLSLRLSLSGTPTWPQTSRLRKVVAELPVDATVLETDAPDMTSSMHPGQRNNPEHLPDICRTLVELRGVDAEEPTVSSSRNVAEPSGWD